MAGNTYSFGSIGEKLGVSKIMDNDMNITAMNNPNEASAFAGGGVDTTVTQEDNTAPAMDANTPNFEM